MDLTTIMNRLAELGDEQTKKTFMRHGATEPLFGVKIGDLKKYLVKELKNNNELALALFNTGNSDAQYLAGLIINPKKVTKEQLQTWVAQSNWSMISESIVASVAAESPYAVELATEWMKSEKELIQDSGWAAYANFISITPDSLLNRDEILELLKIVEITIHSAKNRVRYSMNQFVICVGSYYAPLVEEAAQVASIIGKVSVNVGNTACKVPIATETIEKIIKLNRVGKKRKNAVC